MQDRDCSRVPSAYSQLKKTVGIADCCELLSRAFSFPDEEFARAVADGSFLEDARSCLSDAGGDSASISKIEAAMGSLQGGDPFQLCDNLRKEYSLLFLVPGAQTPVWPYESAFLHAASGKESAPILFRSPISLSVEAEMRACGVRAGNDRREPCDSIWSEFAFLSFLYGFAAQTLFDGDDKRCAELVKKARDFMRNHGESWFSAFMLACSRESRGLGYGGRYDAIAGAGLELLKPLAADAGAGRC